MRKAIDKTIAILLAIILAFMLICVVWQVISRYLLPVSPFLQDQLGGFTPMTEEIAKFGLIWLGVIGAGYVTGLKKHLAIDLLSTMLSPKNQKILGIVVEISIISFAAIVMIYGGFDLIKQTFVKNQVSPVMHLPFAYVYLSVPLSGIMVASYSVINLLERLHHRASDDETIVNTGLL